MAVEVGRKPRISAASARSHTRKDGAKRGRTTSVYAGLLRKFVLILGAVVGGLFYKAITPPPVKVLNSPGGPQVTAPRIETRDGRHIAYKEVGVRESAKHNIIHIHGLGGSRHLIFPVSKEIIEELGLYIVSFDRAGYGQSDPNPKRSIKSDVEDVEDLANGLALGPKFYVISTSIGGYTGWGLIKYKPERLLGIAFSAPPVNFWWPGCPSADVKVAWATQRIGDKMTLRVAHYFPALLNWYMTQSWFPRSSVNSKGGIKNFNQKDQEIMKKMATLAPREHLKESTQQGDFESKYRDTMVMFSNWPFTPMSLENPFEIPVHIYQGTEDYLVPVALQRCVARSLPWVTYHELPGYGHFLNAYPGFADDLVQTLFQDSRQSLVS